MSTDTPPGSDPPEDSFASEPAPRRWPLVLAAGLVMIDSPVITGWRAHSLQVVKATGLVRRVSPGRISRTRRHEWPDRDAVRAHFAAKAAFARWDPRVLEDYVRAGFEEHAMPAPHVLVLRLYVRPPDSEVRPVLVCEDPATGAQSAFGNADELWQLVLAKLLTPRTQQSATPMRSTAWTRSWLQASFHSTALEMERSSRPHSAR